MQETSGPLGQLSRLVYSSKSSFLTKEKCLKVFSNTRVHLHGNTSQNQGQGSL